MSELWLIAVFVALLIIALAVAVYPLRKKPRVLIVLVPFAIIVIVFAYGRWGAWPAWREYEQQAVKQQQVQAMLESMNGPQELIEKLQAQLTKQPESARGWYLLGRLYVGQNDWQHAQDAFAKAHQLKADDEQITVNYAQSIWQLNHQRFDETSRGLFKSVLQKNNNQPDALAMLAMDAYMNQDYHQAIEYWQRLLSLAPQDSDDAKAIRKAIAKAQLFSGLKSEPQS